MKKTEFLLKLKLQKGIGYVKLLTIANQLTDLYIYIQTTVFNALVHTLPPQK